MVDLTLLSAASSWVMSNAVEMAATAPGTVIGGVVAAGGDRVFSSCFRTLKERFGGITGPEDNHDVAKALRLAQLQALEHVVRGFEKTWRAPDLAEDGALFLKRATLFCRTALGRCLDTRLKLNMQINPVLLNGIEGILGNESSAQALAQSDLATKPDGTHETAAQLSAQFAAEAPERLRDAAMVARRDALRRLTEDAVLEELGAELGEVVMPPSFVKSFRLGAAGKDAWFELFGAYVVQQIKESARFRDLYVVDVLLQVKGLQLDQTRAMAILESRFTGVLTEIDHKLDGLADGQARMVSVGTQ